MDREINRFCGCHKPRFHLFVTGPGLDSRGGGLLQPGNHLFRGCHKTGVRHHRLRGALTTQQKTHARTQARMHFHACTHTHTHTHTLTHAHTHTCARAHMHTRTHTHTDTHTRMHKRTHAQQHTCTHAHTLTRTRTRTRTPTPTRARSLPFFPNLCPEDKTTNSKP